MKTLNPILFAIPVFLALIAIELVWCWRKGLAYFNTQDTITSLSLGILSQFMGAIGKLFTVGIYAVIAGQYGSFDWDIQHPATWLLALLMYDFLYYWFHRAGHEVNLMWAMHIVHHSSEEYNLSTALRQSSTGFLFAWVFYLPMALLGIPVLVFAVVALIDLLYQFWVHTRLVPKLGWFDRVFVSPSNHRVHHGQNTYCLDKNYGGILIVWDRLFGTFAQELDNEPVVYGVRKPLASWNPIWGNLHHYAYVLAGVFKSQTWQHRLLSVLAPPSWLDEHRSVGTPFEPSSFKPYTTAASVPLKLYAGLSLVCSTAGLAHFLYAAPSLPGSMVYAYIGCAGVAFLGLGWVWTGARWALLFEAARVLITCGALVLGFWFTPVSTQFQWLGGFVLLGAWVLLGMVYRSSTLMHQP